MFALLILRATGVPTPLTEYGRTNFRSSHRALLSVDEDVTELENRWATLVKVYQAIVNGETRTEACANVEISEKTFTRWSRTALEHHSLRRKTGSGTYLQPLSSYTLPPP